MKERIGESQILLQFPVPSDHCPYLDAQASFLLSMGKQMHSALGAKELGEEKQSKVFYCRTPFLVRRINFELSSRELDPPRAKKNRPRYSTGELFFLMH